jgi:hypothetical protein
MSLSSRRSVHRLPRQDHKDGDYERQCRGVAACVKEEQPSRDGAPTNPASTPTKRAISARDRAPARS